jgi:titin
MNKRFTPRHPFSRRLRLLPALEQVERRCLLATFVVTNTMDNMPGQPPIDGSLQAAIDAVNNDTSDDPTHPDQITFNIPQSDPGFNRTTNTWTISPISPLDGIGRPVFINGYSQPGSKPNTSGPGQDNAVLTIVLDGSHAGQLANGLLIGAGNSTISGLVIANFKANGISILNSGAGDLITGDIIGLNAAGTQLASNFGDGVQSAAPFTLIGGPAPAQRNVISGNIGNGINFGALAVSSLVEGNIIGTGVTGTQDLGNGLDGVQSLATAVIGGTNPGARNLIAGNLGDGIALGQFAAGSQVEGNVIGTVVNGTQRLGNAGDGVRSISLSNNTIGGTAAGAGNYIAGNLGDGIAIASFTSKNAVLGNFIGLSPAGTAAGNGGDGIRVENSSNNTLFGNVVADNLGNGIEIDFALATNNVVQGNRIGTDSGGSLPLGNHLDGIFINDAPATTIGGAISGARNVISANDGSGIEISGTDALRNVVEGNFIGTNAAGSAALGNGANGITITDVGSTTSAATPVTPIQANLISANAGAGIQLNGATTNVLIQGNLIGTDITGTRVLGSQQLGLFLSSAGGNTIGGTSAGQRNVISGNMTAGIQIFRTSGGLGNSIIDNYIGTDIFGTSPLGNGTNGIGVFLNDNARDAFDVVSGNVISGNGLAGVQITGPSNQSNPNQVLSNKIGTDPSGAPLKGMSPITNSSTTAPQQIGVLIQGSFGNTIGGPGSNDNVIADNLAGVEITGINGNANLGAGAASPSKITANPTLVDRIIDNMVTGNLIGIFLNDTTDNLIEGNTITGNVSTGVTLLGTRTSGNLIQGNMIAGNIGTRSTQSNPIGTGIYIEAGQNNNILSNTLSKNPAAGLYLFDRALGNVATGNKISKNGYGMFLFNSAGNADSLRTAKNKNTANKTANFREFTGRATRRMGTPPPTTPSDLTVQRQVGNRHHRG